jgi:hypothetical protein
MMAGMTRLCRLLVLSLVLLVAAGPTTRPDVKADILAAAYAYPDGGGYLWRDTGVPRDLFHEGELILAKSAEGTFCCGFTLAVAFDYAQPHGLFDGKTLEEMRIFKEDWYGNNGAVAGDPLMSTAMTRLGVGGPIAIDDARPGDFLQFWRTNGSGHSVIFLGWLVEDGQRVGVHYRSSNKPTDGIADASERLAAHGGRVKPDALFFARFDEP